uniref:Uncharacterized protein n=1 Tax=Panagrolaimus sp. PS1159 TaxID=55785 RepID=A0AC35FLE5_9BILA
MILSPTLSIFVFVAFSPTFSSSTVATTSNRTFNCYKYEKKFADVNFIDIPDEEKVVIQCDQCLSYACFENNEYILGYGCREDFFKSCNFDSETEGLIYDTRNEDMCSYVEDSDAIVDLCLKNLTCNHNGLKNCIKNYSHDDPSLSMGPVYTIANITIKEVATPTTTTPTTTTESALNPENGNGGKSQNGNGGDSENGNNPSSANSKMTPFIFFFGIFFFAFFM